MHSFRGKKHDGRAHLLLQEALRRATRPRTCASTLFHSDIFFSFCLLLLRTQSFSSMRLIVPEVFSALPLERSGQCVISFSISLSCGAFSCALPAAANRHRECSKLLNLREGSVFSRLVHVFTWMGGISSTGTDAAVVSLMYHFSPRVLLFFSHANRERERDCKEANYCDTS